MAHTYEALELLFHPLDEIGSRVKSQLDAVCQSTQAKEGRDVAGLKRDIRKKWEDEYQEQFKKIRNFMVAHYADPRGASRVRDEVESYWTTYCGMLTKQDAEALSDGSISVENSEGVDGRYRHTFVDTIQERFVDSIFPPRFWATDGQVQEIANFLDKVTDLASELVVPLITRLMPDNVGIEEYRWQLNEDWQKSLDATA
jgi:hypothetical protein